MEQKAVALSGTTGHVPGVSFQDTTTAMRKVGNNCGNLVFQYAVKALLDEPVKTVGIDLSWKHKTVRENCHTLVIPSANFLREGFDFTGYVNFLEGVELPLVFIGLGAQADDFEKSSFDFHPSILRLIDLIRERSPRIAIRGEFTARVLDSFGIDNFEITGCPSNFINPSPDFSKMLSAKLSNPMRSFITHAEEPWPAKQYKKIVEQRLTEWTRGGRSIMVQQSVPAMMKYLRANNPFSTEEVPENFEANLCRALMPEAENIDVFRDFIATRLRTYYSVDQWLEDSAQFDFSIGLRLHGNMVAWQAGTPALWVTHDSRTQELADTMALPSIDIMDFLDNCPTPYHAWERIEFDPAAYDARRAELHDRLSNVLQAAGLKNHPLSVQT